MANDVRYSSSASPPPRAAWGRVRVGANRRAGDYFGAAAGVCTFGNSASLITTGVLLVMNVM